MSKCQIWNKTDHELNQLLQIMAFFLLNIVEEIAFQGVYGSRLIIVLAKCL